MKAIISLFFLTVLIVMFGCGSSETEIERAIELIKTEKIISGDIAKSVANIGIDGMTCSVGCAKRIEVNLAKLEGIKSASVVFEDKVAKVEFDDSKISEENMIEIIEELGDYKVNTVEIEKTVVKPSGGDEANKKKEIKKEASAKSVAHRTISFPNIFDVLTRLYRI